MGGRDGSAGDGFVVGQDVLEADVRVGDAGGGILEVEDFDEFGGHIAHFAVC